MRIKNSKIFKLISSLIIEMIALFNLTMCFAYVATTQRKLSLVDRIMDFIEDHDELIGIIIGLAIIIYFFIRMRKKITEARNNKKEYPSEDNQNPVSKELKDIEKGYIVDYIYTFFIGIIIILLSILSNY